MSFLSRCCSNGIAFCIRHSVAYCSGVCPSSSLKRAANAGAGHARRFGQRFDRSGLLLGAADLNTARRNPGGCLMVQGALACGEAAHSIRQELTACRAAGEAAMRRRFERAKSEGDLPANVNPADLARYIATVLYGMAVQAAGGASRSKLQRVVEMALRTLPM